MVIDPYNKVKLKSSDDTNINKYTNDYLLTIDEFARKHDILIILVAHPTKPSKGDVNYEPTFYDIKGGGEFYDMSPHGILVKRDYEYDLVKIKILKVKFSHLGQNDASFYMKWNKRNGRYSDFMEQRNNPQEMSFPIEDNKNYVDFKKNTIISLQSYNDLPF